MVAVPLIKLYARGPLRHRIAKGLTICGAPKQDTVQRMLKSAASVCPVYDANIPSVWVEPTTPQVLWLDLGPAWLHAYDAREGYFEALGKALLALKNLAEDHKICLLPIGLDPGKAKEVPFVDRTGGASDRHFLCPKLDGEKEIICNFFRLHLPALLAQAANSVVAGNSVYPTASLRLQRSTRHYTARYISCFSPSHLSRVRAWLYRDEGINDLSLLDINPLGIENSIELRFVDAQSLLSTVRAQAILYQAIAMHCCRIHEQGRRVPAVRPRVLERNRALAIAYGPGALFIPDTSTRQHDDRRRDERGRPVPIERAVPPGPTRATRALLDLMDVLVPEFQSLEVAAGEIAPLFSGGELREMGFPALACDGDFQRYYLERSRGQDSRDFLYGLLWGKGMQLERSPSVELNEEISGNWARIIEEAWSTRLMRPIVSFRHRLDASALMSAQTEGKDRWYLLGLLHHQMGAASPRDLGLIDLNHDLRALDRESGSALKRALRPSMENRLRLNQLDGDWSEGTLAAARVRVDAGAMLLLTIESSGVTIERLYSKMRRLAALAPSNFLIVLLHVGRWTERGVSRCSVELLVVSTAAVLLHAGGNKNRERSAAS